jgi:molybdopterin-binding protein
MTPTTGRPKLSEKGLLTPDNCVAGHPEEEGGVIMKVGTRNRLEGEVIQIKCGTVMCLVKVRLPGGAEMESVMTRDSFDGLGIQGGDTVQVAVSALNVLLLKQ